ncbi:NUDIX hydrolase [Sphingobacterium bambusae]|uniref:NUDIX domain-containing protein n=1 Tax=Sphingobacterium bambusae TaxID=662858 RepID=A0ABW6BJH9_9SPHI|nr:NUDIX domain-containing protein [Sphingobacterium bambusae]WPL49948.1 NUDIX domain-containing protein [Sphingobacterium bambusae]
MNKKQLPTAGLLVVREDRLLLAFSRNKQAWYLPGGKIDAGETAKEALLREIEEELGVVLDEEKLVYYGHVTADAYGEENLQMEQSCFLYPTLDQLDPSNEIEAVAYFSQQAYQQEDIQVEGVLIAFERLCADGLIKG